MGLRFAVLFLLLLFLVHASFASAADLKLSGELHYDSVSVTLQNTANQEVSFNLKFELKKKETEWVLVKQLCSLNDSIAPLSSKSYNCSYTTPGPGEYKIFVKADIVGGTYTYKNFLLGKDETANSRTVSNTSETTPIAKEKLKEVSLALVSAPEKVKTGEEFPIIVNITSNSERTLEIYSYVYSGKACYSFLGWKGNAVKLDFAAGETKTLNLTDSVSHQAVNGTYSLKVRAREDLRNKTKDYDLAAAIAVEQVPVDLFKEIPKTQDSRPKTGGTGLPIELLLPILGSLPLIAILIKKVF